MQPDGAKGACRTMPNQGATGGTREPGEAAGRWFLVEPREEGANAEPIGRQAKVERWVLRLEAEPGDLLD